MMHGVVVVAAAVAVAVAVAHSKAHLFTFAHCIGFNMRDSRREERLRKQLKELRELLGQERDAHDKAIASWREHAGELESEVKSKGKELRRASRAAQDMSAALEEHEGRLKAAEEDRGGAASVKTLKNMIKSLRVQVRLSSIRETLKR